jgi:hypothetical protein
MNTVSEDEVSLQDVVRSLQSCRWFVFWYFESSLDQQVWEVDCRNEY